jgi:hypothetical protein
MRSGTLYLASLWPPSSAKSSSAAANGWE